MYNLFIVIVHVLVLLTLYLYLQPVQLPNQTSSVIVQLLALLRNLSDNSSARESLLRTDGLLDKLSSVLLYHCTDPDVAFNLCRLLRYVCVCECVACVTVLLVNYTPRNLGHCCIVI